MFQDETVQGLRPVEGQREPELAVQLAQHARALHQGAAVLVPEIAFPFHRRGGGELADDLLDDVLEGHQPLQLPILVHDERDALVVLLEVLELREHRRAGGNEIGFRQQSGERPPVELFRAHQVHHLAQVQDAREVAELAPVGGEPRVVRGGELREDALARRLQVDRLDLRSGRHHVLDRDRFEVEKVDENALVLLRHELPRFQHQQAQLLHRHPLRMGAALRVYAEHVEQRRDEQVHEPDYRVENPEQRLEHIARERRDALRVGRADDFRRDLGEDEDQEGDHQRGGHHHVLVVPEKLDADDGDERRGCGVHQIVAEQDDPEELVGLREQLGGVLGAPVPHAHERLQPIAVDRHHAGFGDGEKT